MTLKDFQSGQMRRTVAEVYAERRARGWDVPGWVWVALGFVIGYVGAWAW